MLNDIKQLNCVFCRKLHPHDKVSFVDAIRKDLPNYQPYACVRCDYTSNNVYDMNEHFGKVHWNHKDEPKFELKLNPYLEALIERIFVESQIFTIDGLDVAASHTLISDQNRDLDLRNHDVIHKAASSLVVNAQAEEENVSNLLKKSKSILHENEPQAQPNDQMAKGRPKTNIPVADTAWQVVWTDVNTVFFYNPSMKTSVWQRPPELFNRPDVDLLVSKPPDGHSLATQNGLRTSVPVSQYSVAHQPLTNFQFFPSVTRPGFSNQPQSLDLNIKPCEYFFKTGMCNFGTLCRFSHMPVMETSGYLMACREYGKKMHAIQNQERLKTLARSDPLDLTRFFEHRVGGVKQEMKEQDNADATTIMKSSRLPSETKLAEMTSQLVENLPLLNTTRENPQEAAAIKQDSIEQPQNAPPLIKLMQNLNARANGKLELTTVEKPSDENNEEVGFWEKVDVRIPQKHAQQAPSQLENCIFFFNHGWCRWGESCKHSHGDVITKGAKKKMEEATAKALVNFYTQSSSQRCSVPEIETVQLTALEENTKPEVENPSFSSPGRLFIDESSPANLLIDKAKVRAIEHDKEMKAVVLEKPQIQLTAPRPSYMRPQGHPSFSSPGRLFIDESSSANLVIDENESEGELDTINELTSIGGGLAKHANKNPKFRRVVISDSEESNDQSIIPEKEERLQKQAIAPKVKKPTESVIPDYDVFLNQPRMNLSETIVKSKPGTTSSSRGLGRSTVKRPLKNEGFSTSTPGAIKRTILMESPPFPCPAKKRGRPRKQK